MKKFTYTLVVTTLLTMASSLPALANVPVYQDQELQIDEVLVMTRTGPSYYSNVKLKANPDGSIALTQAEHLNLVHVNTVSVQPQTLAGVVQLKVSGDFSTPCTRLEKPAVLQQDMAFTVVLAERPLLTFAPCTEVLAPFETTVNLDVTTLPAGDYTADVNGTEVTFSLDDNP